MGRPTVLRTIWAFIFIGLSVSSAHAGPAPYTDWAFDVRRANEKADLDRLSELTTQSPGFARIYFYGQVFDLVTEGVTEEVKNALWPRLERIAQTLASHEQADPLPALFLDRITSGRLTADAARAREIQQVWFDYMQQGNTLALRLVTVDEPELSQSVFYSLLFRAELATPRLSGQRQRAYLTNMARLMAEGFALGAGNLEPWRALAAFSAGEVASNGQAVVEQQLIVALNLASKGDTAGAYRELGKTLATAQAARGQNLFVALLMNGVAHSAAWHKDYLRASKARVQVLQGIRGLNLPRLTALITVQLVQDHLSAGKIDDLIAYTRELRGMGDVATRDAAIVRVMLTAARELDAGARDSADSGQLAQSIRRLREAELLFEVLSAEAVVALDTVQTSVDAERRNRIFKRAELFRLEGRIGLRRIRGADALKAFETAMNIHRDELQDELAAATAETSMAMAYLSSGDTDKALATTASVESALGEGGDPVVRAGNFLVQGWARFSRGEYARAYGNANYALTQLHNADAVSAQPKLFARLHALAASVLDGAGYQSAATDRIGYALRAAPEDLAIVRMAAVARMAVGDLEGALAAIQPLMDSDYAQQGTVWHGCLLVRANRHAEGIAMLKMLVPQMTLPHLRHVSAEGRTCLIQAYLATGELQEARAALGVARATVAKYPHPNLKWRIDLLDGQVAEAAGRIGVASGSLRQGLDGYLSNLGEKAWRGATLPYRGFAQPVDPVVAAAGLPRLLSRVAARDRSGKDAHITAAIGVTNWLQQWPIAPNQRAFNPDNVSEEDQQVHTLRARISEVSKALSYPGNVGRDRADLDGLLKRLVEEYRGAVLAQQDMAAGVYDYYSPLPKPAVVPDDQALIRYSVGEDATDLWLVVGGTKTYHYLLPGRAKLSAIVTEATQTMNTAPTPWDVEARRPKDPNRSAWKALRRPTATLLPFTKSRSLMRQLAERRVKVILDGPLMRFPLDALVLKGPPRRPLGQPPTFVGGALDLEYVFLPQQAFAAEGERNPLSIMGPLAASDGDCLSDLEGRSLCDPNRIAGMSSALVEGLGEQAPKDVLTGTAVNAKSTLTSLVSTKNAIILMPLDTENGELLVMGDEGYDRIDADTLGLLSNQADELFFGNVSHAGFAAERGDGLRRVMAALRAGGAQTVVLNAVPDDVDPLSAHTLGAYLAAGKGLASAVHSLRADAMAMAYDMEVGGPVIHHPYYWARWMTYTSGDVAAERVDPVYSETPEEETEETDDPFAEDGAGATSSDGASDSSPAAAPASPAIAPPVEG